MWLLMWLGGWYQEDMGMKSVVLAMMALAAISGLAEAAPSATESVEVKQCEALASTDFSRIQDAPTQITEANLIKRKDDLPAHCQVKGYVTPQVGFEIRLPVNNWNGKFMETGCGGTCGVITIDWLCPGPLRKGYACITTDMGHEDRSGGGLWAYNNPQEEIDWGFRATHVTAIAGKAITEQYYRKTPSKAYFMGCSTGGRQGMVEAQRFPWDFDGIIAGAPASDQSGTIMIRLWAALAMRDKDGKSILSSTDLQLVHDAVVDACDMNDGVKDGLIGDPRACHFDPLKLVCKGQSSTECLSMEQANALKRIYTGPMTSKGKEIYTDGALMPGAELAFGGYFESKFSSFDVNFLRYMAFVPDPGPNWQPSDLNFDRDYKRFGMMESLYAGTNPDLRKFKAAGGKIILYHGWSDAGPGGIPPLKTVDYYETVEKTMGGPAATQDFFRLFMIPGMGHCGGGEGALDIDYLSYLEAWVEKDHAPDAMIGKHLDEERNDPKNIKFTRPVYPYPLRARYRGSGDPNDAASFVPESP
jgi:Tannase and feruloyl esterase